MEIEHIDISIDAATEMEPSKIRLKIYTKIGQKIEKQDYLPMYRNDFLSLFERYMENVIQYMRHYDRELKMRIKTDIENFVRTAGE